MGEDMEAYSLKLLLDVGCSTSFDSSSSYSSSSSSSSDSEDVKERKRQPKVKDYVSTIQLFDDKQFQHHFRLGRRSCNILIQLVSISEAMPQYFAGRENTTIEKAVYLTVWYLSNQETFRQIADRFDVSKSTAHSIIYKVVGFIVTLAPDFIKWPTAQEAGAISYYFKNQCGIDEVIGAIDGSHITINRPSKDAYTYCNRKGTHSILLQVLCVHNKTITDVFCGEPGSVHDARMLKRSQLYADAQNGFMRSNVILGDSAYPNLPWLIPPFKDNGKLTNQQKLFNYKHSSARVIVENSIGLLKGRFRRLRHFDNININFIVAAIIAACVLHNICINESDSTDIVEYTDLNDELLYDNELVYNVAGKNRRDEIFENMFK